MGQELDKSSVDAAVWKEAVAREAVIRALASSDQPNRAEVLRACRQLGVKRARLYQLLKAYRTRPVTTSLLVRPAGTRRGAHRLPMETEAVVAEALAQFYETLQKPSVNRLHQEVRRLCRARGVKAPSWHTLRARIDAIDPAELTRARTAPKPRGSLSPGPRRILCRARL